LAARKVRLGSIDPSDRSAIIATFFINLCKSASFVRARPSIYTGKNKTDLALLLFQIGIKFENQMNKKPNIPDT
jgi:hypothetical protein